MLSGMLKDLKEAKASGDEKEITRAYNDLSKVGMDRMTADMLNANDTNVNIVSIAK